LYGESVTIPGPERVGYTFLGWYADETLYLEDTMPFGGRVLTAHWSGPNIYRIFFDSNGGSVLEPAFVERDYAEQLAGLEPAIPPVRDGYRFTRWLPVMPDTMPATDLAVTAQWEALKYAVKFDLSGGQFKQADLAIVDGLEIAHSTMLSRVSIPRPEKEGHTFAGWENIPELMPMAPLTLKAKWDPLKFMITFKAVGGVFDDGSIGEYKKEYLYNTTLSAPTPLVKGHTVSGWSPSMPLDMKVRKAETYTAQLIKNHYPVTFNANGGVFEDESQAVGNYEYASVINPPAVSRTGYEFTGWLNQAE